MIDDASLRASMVEAALDFVRAYDWDANKSTYIDIVDSVIRRDRPRESPADPEQRGTLAWKARNGF
jgi:hypothetical protein